MFRDQLEEMFFLQNKLNEHTNGKKWKSGISKNGKSINWFRCIYMEAAEGIDSFNWKHWKDISLNTNWDNLKIEVVDIWHFILSRAIVDNYKVEDIDRIYRSTKEINSHSLDSIELLENIMKNTLNNELPFVDFFFLVKSIPNFDINNIYKLYISKNCLNQFRQDNGYKEGTYIKIWNGKEDNVFITNLIKEKKFSFYDLYAELEKEYKKIKN
jgi:dimeric dUTPase (all-alpha-NTP-PPase superfamily)